MWWVEVSVVGYEKVFDDGGQQSPQGVFVIKRQIGKMSCCPWLQGRHRGNTVIHLHLPVSSPFLLHRLSSIPPSHLIVFACLHLPCRHLEWELFLFSLFRNLPHTEEADCPFFFLVFLHKPSSHLCFDPWPLISTSSTEPFINSTQRHTHTFKEGRTHTLYGDVAERTGFLWEWAVSHLK